MVFTMTTQTNDKKTPFYTTLAAQVLTDGGFTFSINDGASPTDGFMVSKDKSREVIVPLSFLTEDVIIDYILDNWQQLHADGACIGAWVTELDGIRVVYLDVSYRVADKDAAIVLAKEHNQLAIFDLATFEEIKTA